VKGPQGGAKRTGRFLETPIQNAGTLMLRQHKQ